MKNIFIASTALLILLNVCIINGQGLKYSKVRIDINRPDQIKELIDQDVLMDHFTKSSKNKIEAEVSDSQIRILKDLNYNFEILIDDITVFYQESLDLSRAASAPACGLQNFNMGSMGHYHTYDEILAHLDSMRSKYPNLITVKQDIGTSIEGRKIYAIKISDNPDSNEVSTESSVYYDALHHAREPLSMEPLLYYMWWLLENYNTDPVATYIVNNRQLHFVPCVNPDGYVYNQSTDPNGGGMWRKNRRNSGGGNFGVDLNRNYSSQFGNPIGSSSNPSSGTYHGDSAFSEPESRAVRDYILSVDPVIAFACHSSGQKYLISPGCMLPNEDFESYAEFSSEFINNSFAGYGTTFQMLNYTSCGTTRHFMHDRGIYAWTPEIGSSFWAPQSEFCSTIQNFQDGLKYIAMVSGSYPRVNDFDVLPPDYVLAGDTLSFTVRVKNRGIAFNADSVTVSIESLNTNGFVIDSTKYLGNIASRFLATDTFRIAINPLAQLMDVVALRITIKEKDFISHSIDKEVRVGYRNILFEENSENGMNNWTTPTWDTTFIDMQSGSYSITDSRYGNYESNDNRLLGMNPKIDLTNATNPWMEFNAKWSLESWDDLFLQVSTTGISWTTVASYTEHQHWTQQRVDLSSYIGQILFFRLQLISDGSVQGDGFYFDDLKVVDYAPFPTSTYELYELSTFSVFPNPSSGLIHLHNPENRTCVLRISDQTGRILHNTSVHDIEKTIDIGKFGSGLYFVEVRSENAFQNFKIIVH